MSESGFYKRSLSIVICYFLIILSSLGASLPGTEIKVKIQTGDAEFKVKKDVEESYIFEEPGEGNVVDGGSSVDILVDGEDMDEDSLEYSIIKSETLPDINKDIDWKDLKIETEKDTNNEFVSDGKFKFKDYRYGFEAPSEKDFENSSESVKEWTNLWSDGKRIQEVFTENIKDEGLRSIYNGDIKFAYNQNNESDLRSSVFWEYQMATPVEEFPGGNTYVQFSEYEGYLSLKAGSYKFQLYSDDGIEISVKSLDGTITLMSASVLYPSPKIMVFASEENFSADQTGINGAKNNNNEVITLENDTIFKVDIKWCNTGVAEFLDWRYVSSVNGDLGNSPENGPNIPADWFSSKAGSSSSVEKVISGSKQTNIPNEPGCYYIAVKGKEIIGETRTVLYGPFIVEDKVPDPDPKPDPEPVLEYPYFDINVNTDSNSTYDKQYVEMANKNDKYLEKIYDTAIELEGNLNNVKMYVEASSPDVTLIGDELDYKFMHFEELPEKLEIDSTLHNGNDWEPIGELGSNVEVIGVEGEGTPGYLRYKDYNDAANNLGKPNSYDANGKIVLTDDHKSNWNNNVASVYDSNTLDPNQVRSAERSGTGSEGDTVFWGDGGNDGSVDKGDYIQISRYQGYILIPTEGSYRFCFMSDDGLDVTLSKLDGTILLAGSKLTDSNNLRFEQQGEVQLKAGDILKIDMKWFNLGAGQRLELLYLFNSNSNFDGAPQVPAEWFYAQIVPAEEEIITNTETSLEGVHPLPSYYGYYYIALRIGEKDELGNANIREVVYGPFYRKPPNPPKGGYPTFNIEIDKNNNEEIDDTYILENTEEPDYCEKLFYSPEYSFDYTEKHNAIRIENTAYANINIKGEDLNPDNLKYQFVRVEPDITTGVYEYELDWNTDVLESNWKDLAFEQEEVGGIDESDVIPFAGQLSYREYKPEIGEQAIEWRDRSIVFDPNGATENGGTLTTEISNSNSKAAVFWCSNPDIYGPGGSMKNDKSLFAYRFWGYIKPQETGYYRFATIGDDGVRFAINGSWLVNHFQPSSSVFIDSETIVKLEKDKYYPIQLEWYDSGSDKQLRLLYLFDESNGDINNRKEAYTDVPSDWFYASNNEEIGNQAEAILKGVKSGGKYNIVENENEYGFYYLALRIEDKGPLGGEPAGERYVNYGPFMYPEPAEVEVTGINEKKEMNLNFDKQMSVESINLSSETIDKYYNVKDIKYYIVKHGTFDYSDDRTQIPLLGSLTNEKINNKDLVNTPSNVNTLLDEEYLANNIYPRDWFTFDRDLNEYDIIAISKNEYNDQVFAVEEKVKYDFLPPIIEKIKLRNLTVFNMLRELRNNNIEESVFSVDEANKVVTTEYLDFVEEFFSVNDLGEIVIAKGGLNLTGNSMYFKKGDEIELEITFKEFSKSVRIKLNDDLFESMTDTVNSNDENTPETVKFEFKIKNDISLDTKEGKKIFLLNLIDKWDYNSADVIDSIEYGIYDITVPSQATILEGENLKKNLNISDKVFWSNSETNYSLKLNATDNYEVAAFMMTYKFDLQARDKGDHQSQNPWDGTNLHLDQDKGDNYYVAGSRAKDNKAINEEEEGFFKNYKTDGAYVGVFNVMDKAGNISPDSPRGIIFVDTEGPAISGTDIFEKISGVFGEFCGDYSTQFDYPVIDKKVLKYGDAFRFKFKVDDFNFSKLKEDYQGAYEDLIDSGQTSDVYIPKIVTGVESYIEEKLGITVNYEEDNSEVLDTEFILLGDSSNKPKIAQYDSEEKLFKLVVGDEIINKKYGKSIGVTKTIVNETDQDDITAELKVYDLAGNCTTVTIDNITLDTEIPSQPAVRSIAPEMGAGYIEYNRTEGFKEVPFIAGIYDQKLSDGSNGTNEPGDTRVHFTRGKDLDASGINSTGVYYNIDVIKELDGSILEDDIKRFATTLKIGNDNLNSSSIENIRMDIKNAQVNPYYNINEVLNPYNLDGFKENYNINDGELPSGASSFNISSVYFPRIMENKLNKISIITVDKAGWPSGVMDGNEFTIIPSNESKIVIDTDINIGNQNNITNGELYGGILSGAMDTATFVGGTNYKIIVDLSSITELVGLWKYRIISLRKDEEDSNAINLEKTDSNDNLVWNILDKPKNKPTSITDNYHLKYTEMDIEKYIVEEIPIKDKEYYGSRALLTVELMDHLGNVKRFDIEYFIPKRVLNLEAGYENEDIVRLKRVEINVVGEQIFELGAMKEGGRK